ncbi:MAG: AzlC family ABC transporter permease [Proteobacteria bacterium]|nr:AzlC family ABC transporter permease [Pseudomonadota bacterium]MDA1059907.1 AzlC family ABC transporter permease [Pseudomonadota bacterium]
MSTPDTHSQSSWWRDIFRGIGITLPVLAVYVAVGMAYGVLAVDSGIPPWLAVLMSAMVYAGTAQLVGVQMIALSSPPLSIIITAAVINARFFVMASALVPYLRHLTWWQRLLYGVQMTDATFALHISRLPHANASRTEIFTTNVAGHIVWIGATIAGVIVGQTANNLEAFAIDFAMPAMFIGLLVPLVRGRSQLLVAIAAGAGTLAFHAAGLAFWAILLATLTGLVIGWGADRWAK